VVVAEDQWGLTERSGGTVAITPLGTWVAGRVTGRTTRQVGELRDLDAEQLLAVTGDMDVDEAFAEIEAWCAARGSASAAREIAAAAAGADTGTLIMAFGAFDVIDLEEAEPAVRRLQEDPAAGPFARLWLVNHDLEDHTILGDAETPETLVRVLATVLDLGGPEALVGQVRDLGEFHEQRAFVEGLWQLDLAEVEPVLEAIGGGHPEKTVAKAARKALFKHRTSRAS
jgi:hypothetical protein